jgi:hypothetical protein
MKNEQDLGIIHGGGFMFRVLQVVFYDLDNPMHGGQIRCQQINRKLQELGFSVTLLTIFGLSGGKTSLGPQINVPEDYQLANLGELSNGFAYLAFDSYFQTPEGENKLRNMLSVDSYDVVWEDHPYIHTSLKSYFATTSSQPVYVYSSQNVESELVKSLLDTHQAPIDLKDKVGELVKKLEKQAVLDANIVLAVTHSDLETFASFGTQASLVRVPNASRCLPSKLSSSGSIISDLGLSRYALFIGSAHPPNVQGFLKMLGESLEYLHPDFQIVCVGGVSWGIRHHFASLEEDALPLIRLTLIADASNEEIDQLRLGASVMLLPILGGGGSNLKTAEALLSPGSIVATPTALRGFEDYCDSPGVFVAETPAQFQKLLAKISRGEEDVYFRREQLDGSPLTWDKALAPLDKLTLGRS